MKKLITCLFVAALAISVSAITYTENFDTASNWDTIPSGHSVTAYDYDKTYINDAVEPANDEFTLTGTQNSPIDAGLREESTVYGGSGYAFRFASTGTTTFRYKIDTGVTDFSVYLARWDNSPIPNFTIRYSTDSGTTYTDLLSTNGSWFTSDKTYKQYKSAKLNISPDSGKEIYIEVQRTSGERILADQFEVNFVPEPAIIGIIGLTLLFVRRK